jgi:hypothetical protein
MEMFGATGKVVICIVLILFVAGCTTMRPLPSTDAHSIASSIEVGDKVEIIRNDASDVKFKVETISNEGLDGDGIFVAYSDILQIRFSEHSTAKTVGLIAVILVVVKGLYDYGRGVTDFIDEI